MRRTGEQAAGGPPDGGERDLGVLLGTLAPVRNPGTFVFAEAGGAVPADAVVVVREAEGTTVVLPRERAGDPAGPAMAWITLRVHSSLEAVGLTAAVAAALAREGIPANVVAGLRHDHLFVPEGDAERAVATLEALATRPDA